MRRLILLRHAKSDRPAGVPDRDRPLAERGRAAAPRMGTYLVREGLRPGHVMVSPARRTQETWEAVRAAMGEALAGIEAETVPMIYEAPAPRLLDAVRAAPDQATCLMLVGHNPGLQDLAVELAARGDRRARERLATQFPTAAVAVIDLEAERWAEIAWGQGVLERFVKPRDLDAAADDD